MSFTHVKEREKLLMFLDYTIGTEPLNVQQIAAKYKRGYSTTARILKQISQSQELKDKAQLLLDSEGADILTMPTDVINATNFQALQDENAFLMWWNTGERKGWVDRLLKKVQE